MTEQQLRWFTFGALCLLMPVFVFLFVAYGFAPLPALLFPGVEWATIALIHAAVFAPLWYCIALAFARSLSHVSSRARLFAASGVAVGLFALSWVPIFGFCYNSCNFKALWNITF